ncbi:hypothetical protein SRIMM317S_03901 [Streptomyces rimosus subsp. rimosus]
MKDVPCPCPPEPTLPPSSAPASPSGPRGSFARQYGTGGLDAARGARSHQRTARSNHEEVFVVTGRIAATVGGEEVVAGPGDAIIVPPRTELSLRNGEPDTPATVTVITSAGIKATLGGATFPPPWAQ